MGVDNFTLMGFFPLLWLQIYNQIYEKDVLCHRENIRMYYEHISDIHDRKTVNMCILYTTIHQCVYIMYLCMYVYVCM